MNAILKSPWKAPRVIARLCRALARGAWKQMADQHENLRANLALADELHASGKFREADRTQMIAFLEAETRADVERARSREMKVGAALVELQNALLDPHQNSQPRESQP